MATAAKTTLKSIVWPLLKPYRWWLAGAIGLNAFHGIALSLQALMPKWLIDDVLLAEGLSPTQRWHRVAWLIGVYLVISMI